MLPSHKSDLPRRSEADQRAFFEEVLGLAHTAEAMIGAIARDIVVAGSRIRLVFAGPALEVRLMKALAHRLAATPGTPDLVLNIWDSESTGVAMCPPPVGRHCFSDRGDIWTFHSRRVKSAFHWSEFSLSLLDLDRGQGVFWVRTAEGLPYWTLASPFRSLFHWWMEEQGAQLVHAAAVGTCRGGVLITGKGGVGKSTTALSCLAAGFNFVGDDYVVLTGGERPRAHSLYGTAKVNPEDMERFAAFAPRLLGSNGEVGGQKAVMYLDRAGPGRLIESVPVDAVLTPRFGKAAETQFEAADPALLVGAAIYTTLAQLPHAGQWTVDFIEKQLGRAPGYSLVLGAARDRVPGAIADWLDKRAPPPPAPRPSPAPVISPLISVVIPVWNGAHFLPEAVATVLAQRHAKVEIIVVDDGSTDAIEDAVAALPVQVRFLRQGNGGPGAARNLGIRAASAELLAMLDVDDLWPARKLAASLAWLTDHPDTDVVLGRGQLMEASSAGAFEFVGSPADGYPLYLGSALFRRRAFERAGLFDPHLRLGEDTDWFTKAEQSGERIDRLEMVTLLVRRHAANTTRNLTALEMRPLRLVRNALARKRPLPADHA